MFPKGKPQPTGALVPFADFHNVIEALEELRVAREAVSALEEWQSDPSTARLWRDAFAELGVDVSEE